MPGRLFYSLGLSGAVRGPARNEVYFYFCIQPLDHRTLQFVKIVSNFFGPASPLPQNQTLYLGAYIGIASRVIVAPRSFGFAERAFFRLVLGDFL